MLLFYTAGINQQTKSSFDPPPLPSPVCEFASNTSPSVKALLRNTVSDCHTKGRERIKLLVIIMQKYLKQWSWFCSVFHYPVSLLFWRWFPVACNFHIQISFNRWKSCAGYFYICCILFWKNIILCLSFFKNSPGISCRACIPRLAVRW